LGGTKQSKNINPNSPNIANNNFSSRGVLVNMDVGKESKFVLDGVELNGLFSVYTSKGKWHLNKFQFKETKIEGEDMNKLAEAAKSGNAVALKFGNGEGKVVISNLFYDPSDKMLTSISMELTEWTLK